MTHRRALVAAFAAGVATTLLVAALPRARAAAAVPYGTSPLASVREVYDLLTQSFAGKVSVNALITGAIRGMAAAAGDPFTQYYDPQQAASLLGTLQGGFVGIGVTIGPGPNGYPQVLSVVPNGPADKAGVRSEDQIVFVDGQTTLGHTLQGVAKMIQGPLGQPVILALRRAGDPSLIVASVTRGNVNPSPSVSEQSLPDHLAEIRISQFAQDTGSLFTAALDKAEASKPVGLILDLRNDPGGYVQAAVAVARQIVPAGPIVKVVDAHGNATTFSANGHPTLPPLAVLVNGNTASAAEILSGAIQARGAGVVIGERTYGKGSVQELFSLSNGGDLKMTIAHDFTPAGAPIEGHGITPNVIVPPPPPPPAVPAFASIGARVLTTGLVGLDVLGVQQRLAWLGYDPGQQNGIYDATTYAAAAHFALAEGLPLPSGGLSIAFQKRLDAVVAQKIEQALAPPTHLGILAAAEKYLLQHQR